MTQLPDGTLILGKSVALFEHFQNLRSDAWVLVVRQVFDLDSPSQAFPF
jgi:hypothetical protein